jgi:hypothetical protein
VSLSNTRLQASTLVVQVGEAGETRERTDHLDHRSELPRVDVLAVAADVPAAREDEARARRRMVEDGLGRACRVPVHSPRDEHHEHPVTSSNRPADYRAIVRRARDDLDLPLELVELADALLSAHGDNLVAAVERMLDHVSPQLPGGADDADLHQMAP